MRAFLALEDGTIYEGDSFGAPGKVAAEICFNTSMTGYQEILTDPSYRGQVVVMTYPEIGNYGVNEEDQEADHPHVSGFVVRELSPVASNWRSRGSLPEYLRKHGIPGLAHVDTRALTKKLRSAGVMKGLLCAGDNLPSPEEAAAEARAWHGMEGSDYVKEVTCKKPYTWDASGAESRAWQDSNQLVLDPSAGLPGKPRHKIVAYDFGIKRNILRRLRQHGFEVTVVPATTPASEVLALNPDGVFLSNGPGDPAALDYVHQIVREIVPQKPIFGICLGHQILGHVFGGKTFKLKFGHRGGNQPIKDLRSGLVSITAQNHGFAVDPESLPTDVEVTHVNMNDGTCAGLRHKTLPVFSVQYHPEAAPGPHDATPFFEEFSKEVEKVRQGR
jgi:carbamoyl-phosphate synthase small subunit